MRDLGTGPGTSATRPSIVIRAVVLCALLTGCAPDLTVLSNDKNPVCLKWSTPWGSGQVDRLFGCEMQPRSP